MLKLKTRRETQRGFSLIEVIIVIVVIAIVVLPMSQLVKANLYGLGRYTLMTMAQYDAQSIMEQVMLRYASNGGGPTGYASTKAYWAGKSGTTSSGYAYLVTMSAEATLNGVPYTVVTVTLSGKGFSSIVLSTWIST